jgi:hypothetical protein
MIDLITKGKTINLLMILKKIKKECNDISFIVNQLLEHGDLLFYRYVKQEYPDILNSYSAMDIILHSQKPTNIIQILEYNIFDFEYSAKVNEEPIEKVMYMFLQFTEYDEIIKEFMFKKYPDILNEYGLFKHLLFYNVPNEVIVYMKACMDNDKFTDYYVNLTKILESYTDLKNKNTGSIFLRSRLINVINMIINIHTFNDYPLPSYEEFLEHFKKFYSIKDTSVEKDFLKEVPYDIYNHIFLKCTMSMLRAIFPPVNDNIKWSDLLEIC